MFQDTVDYRDLPYNFNCRIYRLVKNRKCIMQILLFSSSRCRQNAHEEMSNVLEEIRLKEIND